MIVVDVSEDEKVIAKLTEKLGKDNFKIEQIGCWDCKDKLFPIKNGYCIDKDEMECLEGTDIVPNKDYCKDCNRRKYIRFADFTNDTHSFYYERKTVFDFISSRKRRLYNQLDKMNTFIEGRKGLILEGMADFVVLYDAYWKNINKKLLQKLSPMQQVVALAGTRKIEKIVNGIKTIEEVDTKEWTWSFVRELKMREMEFVQTWNLDETIDFITQCDEGYDKASKLRLIPKRYPEFPIERNILALFDGIGKVRSERIIKNNPEIVKILNKLTKKVKELDYGKNKTR